LELACIGIALERRMLLTDMLLVEGKVEFIGTNAFNACVGHPRAPVVEPS